MGQHEARGVAWLRRRGLRLVEAQIHRRFPAVPEIGRRELAAWLAREGEPTPVLLDAREADEFAVSHLAGALRIDPGRPDVGSLGRDPARPMVVYCSVGYRSARVAAQLIRSGFEPVFNLRGGVFGWALDGRPLWCPESGSGTLVHPFDSTWGLLLDPELRAGTQGDDRAAP